MIIQKKYLEMCDNLDNPPSSRRCHSHYNHQNDLIHYQYYLCSITISKKTEQNALSFQSLTILLGSIYLLNINSGGKSFDLRNVEEAENIGSLVYLAIFQFPLRFPSVKGQIREREGNEKIHSHNSGTEIRGFHCWEWTGREFPLNPDI